MVAPGFEPGTFPFITTRPKFHDIKMQEIKKRINNVQCQKLEGNLKLQRPTDCTDANAIFEKFPQMTFSAFQLTLH